MSNVGISDANGNRLVINADGSLAASSASSVPTDGAVTVNATSTQLLPANTSRLSGFIKNTGTQTVFIKQGATATTSHLPLNPGDLFKVTHQAAVNGIVASGTGTVWAEEENR